MQQPSEIVLPDLFSLTPFHWGGCNPLFLHDNRESTEWLLNFGIFEDQERVRMHTVHAELLGAYTYPYADIKGLCLASDFLMILFALDEVTDAQDGDGAKATRNTIVDALTGQSGSNTSPIVLMAKDYLARLSEATLKEVCARFVTHCIAYIDSTAEEAHLRATNEIMSIDKYTQIRRNTGGVKPLYEIIEAIIGFTLPSSLFSNPDFLHVYNATNDMIGLANDIYSYAVELASGLEGSNIIAILMEHKKLTLQEAFDHAAKIYKGLGESVIHHKARVPSFEPKIDEAIRMYIYATEQWVYGNIVWSFDSKRYFGEDNEMVRRTGIIRIRPIKSEVVGA